MLFIADAMRDSPNNPVVGLVDQVPPSGPGMPIPWPRWSLLLWWTTPKPGHLATTSRNADGFDGQVVSDYPGPARHLESAYSPGASTAMTLRY